LLATLLVRVERIEAVAGSNPAVRDPAENAMLLFVAQQTFT
jgi:hypothetical protein